MPKGPRGEKRPADVIGNAVQVMRIATGEIEEQLTPQSGRRKSGKAGGKARALNLTSEQRKQIASAAAKARWERRSS